MPTPQAARSFVGKDTIAAELRGGNAIKIEKDQPWLLTTKGCYVRANSQYIQPISLPE